MDVQIQKVNRELRFLTQCSLFPENTLELTDISKIDIEKKNGKFLISSEFSGPVTGKMLVIFPKKCVRFRLLRYSNNPKCATFISDDETYILKLKFK